MITYGLKQHYFERWPPRKEHPAKFMTSASSCGEKLGGATSCGHQLGLDITLEGEGRTLEVHSMSKAAKDDGTRISSDEGRSGSL